MRHFDWKFVSVVVAVFGLSAFVVLFVRQREAVPPPCPGSCPWHTEARYLDHLGGCACVLVPLPPDAGAR